ncbi:ABC transporter substrate-binding protein [Actinopolymorpha alba]|uniref:ABC transporter substrate-binding protein n=1 Tax=Actinopolymorpha alba TaxID=533267 RepID=UPI000362E369|nr:ABC transporter substrate-binding protein [Actinopolymorpha alba]
MRTLKLSSALAMAAFLSLLSACGSFQTDSSQPAKGGGSGGDGGGQAVISLQFTPRANFALETDDAFVLTQVGCLETLVKYDDATGKLEPLLATSWTQSKPTEWDFRIRDNVTFQDGTKLTPDTIASALERMLKVEVPPRPFTPDVISSVTAVDASTVRVTTPTPSALVPYRLAAVNTGILAPAAYTKSGVDPLRHCTGPFTPVSVTAKQSMTLERNDKYWGGKAALTKVEARFLPEGATRATQVQTGESQVALAIPAASVPDLKANKDVVVSEAFTPRTSGLYFNVSKAPFNNPDVRKAIQSALDLNAIAASIYDGTAQPAIGPFAPDEAWAPKSVKPVSADLTRAADLLKRSGHAPGSLKVTLLAYTERPEFADLAAIIQDQLEKIGIKVTVRTSDYAAIEPALLGGDYDLSLLSRNHLTDIADPIGFLTADYTCKGTYNISHYCDPSFDAKIKTANAESDAKARYAIYAELAKRLQDEAVTAFLVHEQTVAARRSTVKGFVDDPLARYAVTKDLSVNNG